ncbi:MAG: SDR family oxidoreductase [Bacteroidetes bacterium]|nr:SDR family oxidoreductase [Bacteroidota bacterium]MDA1119609.1 SDR family oxidoreductase [Bacteroidota bacterium]
MIKSYLSIAIGDKEQLKHIITQEDIQKFVDLTGDDNRLHVDAEFSKTTPYKKPVAHGMLGASFISTVIGTKLPGDGALWFSQSLEFLLPVWVGDELTVTAEVIKKFDAEKILELKIEIKNQDRQTVTRGLAKVKMIEMLEEVSAQSTKQKEIKVALVIGGTGGIGRAVCYELAKDGFYVFVHYHSNKKKAEEILSNIKGNDGKASMVSGNVTRQEDIDTLLGAVERYFPRLDVLVNCSSIKIPKISFSKLTWSDFQEQVQFHVKSVFETSKTFLGLLEKGDGKIIVIGTIAVDKPNTDWAHYITAKAALHGLVKAMAIELGPKGIKVNMISPGLTDTELTADIPEKIKLITASQTPLRRLTKVEDISGTVGFMASVKSNFITGENIRINGGQFTL